ncbi:MAG: acyl-CoA dehydrogenase family protein [Steroidobacteraceae bacterium]|jgi:acyl-CoA dehydrogenase|nr:acyl-CoA dehydrogenase family protein [Steroidobacteraceae bacterium]
MPDSSWLDWPFYEDRHRALKRELDAWAAAHATLLDAHDPDLDAQCRALARALGDAGWCRYAVPQAYGGALERLDVRSIAILRETLAYHSGLADFVLAMQGLGSGAITLFGTEAQKQRWLPEVATGRAIAAFALSEAAAGSDVAALATTARREGDGYCLDGEKTWISNGGLASFYTVFARTGEAPGAKGLSAFVVPADAAGLSVVERIPVIAPHPLARLRFDGVRVPADAMLGRPGQGFAVAMATLDVFRTTVGAAALGFARRAHDEALRRARSRRLFGAPLADLQLAQAALAESAVAIDASALLVARAGWAKDRGQPRVTREAAMAKLHATDEAQGVIDRSLQLHGGLGVVSGEVVETLYREIRALRIYEGASDVQKVIIARQELERQPS